MFSKNNLNKIPVEETPHSTGSRKIIVNKQEIPSKYFEALTYGYLPPTESWSLHKHEGIVEICLVIKGSGNIVDKNNNLETFETGDRFIFPPDTEHAIINTSKEIDEFFFFRLKA